MSTSLVLDAPTRSAAPDAVCAQATELARDAATELGGAEVGAHLGVLAEGDRVVTHLFDCSARAYRGWRWAVTVARASRAKAVTVDEVALLAGPDASLAPAWLPWSERLLPGDLGVGDILPTEEDDPRLAPAYSAADDDELDEVAGELALGRVRVLSWEGRVDAVGRWSAGDHGPGAPIAKSAPARCGTCGFLAPLSGALRGVVGVCANEVAPDDGRVVTVDHGCGGHSEAVVLPSTPDVVPTLLDDDTYDELVPSASEHEAGSVEDTSPTEPLGHS